MKKNLFAALFIITLSFLFPAFHCQAAEIASNSGSTSSEVDAAILDDDSFLTVGVIEECFWEKLVDKSQAPISEEDCVIQAMIKLIESQQLRCFTKKAYLAYPINDRVNYERLMQKLEKVVELYNASFDVPIQLIDKSSSEGNFAAIYLEVASIPNPVSYLGQLATVTSEDAVYWESSESFGSGASGNIEVGSMVVVDMVSYLDEDGTISNVSSLKDSVVDIDFSRMHMLHIRSNGKDLGWIYPRDLIV